MSTDQPMPRSMWLLSEHRRVAIVMIGGWLVSAGVLTLAFMYWEPITALVRTDLLGFLLLCSVLVWTTMTVLHIALTWIAYRGLIGDEFSYAITADPEWRKWEQRRQWESRVVLRLFGKGPASWPVTVSVLALIVVVALVLRPSIREIPLVLGMALAMVVAAWLDVVVAYALYYARLGTAHDVFAFPGEEARGLSDYFYVALGVQTAFGTAGVEVLTRELRRVVIGQSLLAFAFNSVILAMILSLLLGLAL